MITTAAKAQSARVPQDWGQVAVLMGGAGAESAVSRSGGQRVLEALHRQGIKATGMEPGAETLQHLQTQAVARVFLALHGQDGEDGRIQGALEMIGLPYTGSGVLSSALAMDKDFSKRLWMAAGLPTPPYVVLQADADWEHTTQQTGSPLFIKPARGGSSIGIGRADDAKSFRKTWHEASRYDTRILAERAITGVEYTVSILEQQALPVIRLETERPFYNYQAKYEDTATRYLCPCQLPKTEEQALQALALRASHCLGIQGWGRIDLLRDTRGQSWLIEANTIPGMTEHSLMPMAARQAGIDFDTLVLRILASATKRKDT